LNGVAPSLFSRRGDAASSPDEERSVAGPAKRIATRRRAAFKIQMKFAFSIPGSEPQLEAKAKELGYDGIELTCSPDLRDEIPFGSLAVACLSVGGRVLVQSKASQSESDHLRPLIDRAAGMGCSLVKVLEPQSLRRGTWLVPADVACAWLIPLADYAADRDVTIALDNSQSLRTAREFWEILDRCNHPSLGCCLDVLTSARLGESPEVTVPMLNSKIVYVQLADVKDLAHPATECNLGDGVVPIRTTIARLRGIGYAGWLTLRLSQSTEAVESRLSSGIGLLRELCKPIERAKAKIKATR
jgi:sugar phosphate isomerase/epimerase